MRPPARAADEATVSGRVARVGRLLAAVLVAAAVRPLTAAPLTEPVEPPPGSDSPAAVAAGSTLDRTLQVDTDAAQRNLELLLETRGDGEPLQPPVARRQAPTPPATAASAGAWPGDLQPQPAARADDGRLDRARLVGGLVRVLREHRHWLAGAVGLVVVVAIGTRLWRHRRAGSADRQQQRPSVQHPSPGGRRRSSRR